jgi:small subunit ribosomal protein S4
MGDPRKTRKKYKGPNHPWNKARIEEERVLKKEYGLKNKKEIWKMNSLMKDFSDQAKFLMASTGPQVDKEKQQLLAKLVKLGLIDATQNLNDILSLGIRNVLERRLQTQLYKKSLARSMKQARQFITHEHVTVGGKVITSPSYMLTVQEEAALGFRDNSHLADPEHVERQIISKAEAAKEKKEEDKDKKTRKPDRRERPKKREQPKKDEKAEAKE